MRDHLNPSPPLPAGLLVPPLDEDGFKDHREQQQGAAAHLCQDGSARKQQVGVNLWGGGAKVADFTAGEQRVALHFVTFSSSCQIVVQTADVVQSRLCEADCPADRKAGTESVLDGKDDAQTWSQNIV